MAWTSARWTLGGTISTLNIGTKKNPYPIFLSLQSISNTLTPEYWPAEWKDSIAEKGKNLEKALKGYADSEGIDKLWGRFGVIARWHARLLRPEPIMNNK